MIRENLASARIVIYPYRMTPLWFTDQVARLAEFGGHYVNREAAEQAGRVAYWEWLGSGPRYATEVFAVAVFNSESVPVWVIHRGKELRDNTAKDYVTVNLLTKEDRGRESQIDRSEQSDSS